MTFNLDTIMGNAGVGFLAGFLANYSPKYHENIRDYQAAKMLSEKGKVFYPLETESLARINLTEKIMRYGFTGAFCTLYSGFMTSLDQESGWGENFLSTFAGYAAGCLAGNGAAYIRDRKKIKELQRLKKMLDNPVNAANYLPIEARTEIQDTMEDYLKQSREGRKGIYDVNNPESPYFKAWKLFSLLPYNQGVALGDCFSRKCKIVEDRIGLEHKIKEVYGGKSDTSCLVHEGGSNVFKAFVLEDQDFYTMTFRYAPEVAVVKDTPIRIPEIDYEVLEKGQRQMIPSYSTIAEQMVSAMNDLRDMSVIAHHAIPESDEDSIFASIATSVLHDKILHQVIDKAKELGVKVAE